MEIFAKSDEEVLRIANPIWDSIVLASNAKNYADATKHFSSDLLAFATREYVESQWKQSKLLTSLEIERDFICCLRRRKEITILWKQRSFEVEGEYLARMTLVENSGEFEVTSAHID